MKVRTHESGDFTIMRDVRVVPINKIKPNEWNPNEMSEEMLTSVKYGIRTEGFLTPVLVQASTRRIIDGEHRYKAALELGMEEVLVQFVDCDDVEARKLTLALNNRRGQHDASKLDELLKELKAEDPDLEGLEIGYSQDFFEQLMTASDQWLDDLKSQETDTSFSEHESPEQGPKDEIMRLQFLVSADQKKIIKDRLEAVKQEHDVRQTAEALVILCQEAP